MNLKIMKEETEEVLSKLENTKNKYVNYGIVDENSFTIDDRISFRRLILNFLDERIQAVGQEKQEIEMSIGWVE